MAKGGRGKSSMNISVKRGLCEANSGYGKRFAPLMPAPTFHRDYFEATATLSWC